MRELPKPLARLLPKVKLRDLDWKWVVLLLGLMFITVADDITGIGELLDVFELPVDVLVAMILSRNTLHRAAAREAVVQGKVVDEPASAAPAPAAIAPGPTPTSRVDLG